jgi:putative membrane protein
MEPNVSGRDDRQQMSGPRADTVSAMPPAILHILQGLLMGTADAVPGVSGGTMALIVGIYGRLLASIGHGFRAILAVARFDRQAASSHLRGVEWGLVTPLALGIATAIVVAARFVPDLLDERPVESRAVFLGLVAASLAVPWRQIRDRTRRSIAVATVAAVPAFVLSGLPPGSISDPAPLAIFLGAALAVCAMILPGVSGSFLLLVVGLYEPTLRAVDDRDLAYLGIFVVGMVIGLGSFSLLLGRLLARRHDVTMAVLVGLMTGSLRALWPWQDESRALQAPVDPGLPLALMLGGALFVLVIQYVAWRRTRIDPTRAAVAE